MVTFISFLIAAVIVFGGAYLFGRINAAASEREKQRKRAAWRAKLAEKEKQQAAGGSVAVEVVDDDDREKYSIKGINMREIDDSCLGDFMGTARALKSNKFDPYAIGIYIGSKRVGWFPRGNARLHDEITARGGSVPVEGYISTFTNDDGELLYYGRVWFL